MSMINLKVPDHQVAGHQAHGGKLGPVVDDSGRFYKPLQSNDRGLKEKEFYNSLSKAKIPDRIRRFFPKYYGTMNLPASDGSGDLVHLVLQDVVGKLSHPSVMDIKMGSRTWYPQASDDYIQKCLKKDRESTSWLLGFRISGLQAYQCEESGFYKPDKKQVQNFTVEDVRTCLEKFVSSNPSSDSEPDCLFASVVYGGPGGILAQLKELKTWFEDQTVFEFNSCSVLMVYEKESVESGKALAAEVKLVDFAHAVKGRGVIDHNFLGGLCSLIKFVSEIVTDTGELKGRKFGYENGIKG